MGWRKDTWGVPELWLTSKVLSIVVGLDQVWAPKELGERIMTIVPGIKSDAAKAKDMTSRMWKLVTMNQYLDPADEWKPIRILGAGGFGVAALYERRTAEGAFVDDIVIKTAKLDTQTTKRWWVPREAHVMTQLDERDCESILYLRRWKAYRINSDGDVRPPKDYKLEKSRGSHWRFYLETCPFGDLDILRWRYVAWGQYLPEAFLWHCFKAFAMAANTMAEGGFRHADNFNQQAWESYILHTDIKPQNLFLGRLYGDEFAPNYPIPKLADFGLAEVTYDDFPKNCARYFKRGTEPYYPPEVRTGKTMLKWLNDWANFPFLESNPPSSDHSEGNEYFLPYATHRITAASNIWALGLSLYMLMTMESSSTINKMIENVTEVEYEMNGNHFMSLKDLRTRQFPDYSDELGVLVHECLNLDPEKRPTAQELLTRIDSHMESNKEEGLYDAAEKLYYKGTEINAMEPGRFFENRRNDTWWERFNDIQAWTDPDLEPLDPPYRPEHMHPDAVTSRKRVAVISISSDNDETVRGGVQLPETPVARKQAKKKRGTRFPIGQAPPAGNRRPQPVIRKGIPPGRPQPRLGRVGGLGNRTSLPAMRREPGFNPDPVKKQPTIPYRRRDPALPLSGGGMPNSALNLPICTGRNPALNPPVFIGRDPALDPPIYTGRDPAYNPQAYTRRDPADNLQAYAHANIHQRWLTEQAAAAHANQRLNEGGDIEQRNAQGEFSAPVFHRGGYDLLPPKPPNHGAGGASPPHPQDRGRDSRGLGLDGADDGDVTMKDVGGSSDRENGSPLVEGLGSAVSMAVESVVNFGVRMFGGWGAGR